LARFENDNSNAPGFGFLLFNDPVQFALCVVE
jgi:hypothetical protein